VAYIRDYTSVCRYPPTIRDIAAWFGIAPPTVACHLDAIEKKGAIEREPGNHRGIRLPNKYKSMEH